MTTLTRVVMVDLRLNSDRFLGSMFSCGICLVLAVFFTDAFASLLPIWAALAWYRYGRADTAERDELRASLGLSRADRVRGRVGLIAVESAVLITASTAAALIAVAQGRGRGGGGATMTVSAPPEVSPAVTILVGVPLAAVVLLLTALWIGKECVVRRPGRGTAVLSVVSYLLAGLLTAMLWVPVDMIPLAPEADAVPYVVFGVACSITAVLLSLLLRTRIRTWIGLLDSGAPARQAQTA